MQFQEKFEMITSKKYKNSMSWLAHKFEEKQGEGEGGGGLCVSEIGSPRMTVSRNILCHIRVQRLKKEYLNLGPELVGV